MGSNGRWFGVGLALVGVLIGGVLVDRATDGRWLDTGFDAIAHLFYEQPLLAAIRRPSQLGLFRAHLAIGLACGAIAVAGAPWLSRHGRGFCAVLWVGYAIRAVIWTVGGNLPLVPGDSCHYIEVASSVFRGEGPVKHYVESFFRDYPEIRAGKGVLDDWATPLYAYLLAGAYRLTRVEPGRALEATVAVAKGTSFILNLLALPAIYLFARRRFDRDIGLGAMAALAVLPVHALYAGFALRESLVALASILAVWFLTEIWHADRTARWVWAITAGIAAGLAILARNTSMALVSAAGLYALIAYGRKHLGPLLLWGVVTLIVIAPWAWATANAYGEPFYSYTKYFPYNFSWTVHHYDRGITRAQDFYTWANAPEIARVKVKALVIIVMYSTMIFSLPLMLGFWRRLLRPDEGSLAGRDVDRLVALSAVAFVLATLTNVADVTQVAQLGRYYLPIFVLALPTAMLGMRDWLRAVVAERARIWVAALIVPLVWADPTWAYDATWLVKPYQLHWPALRAAGAWVREHPDRVPETARIMTWFPWEFRLASQRTTILLPRSYYGPHIERTIRQYGVTHVLWGSFEPPPNVDPEAWGPNLERLRLSLGLTDRNELYHTPANARFPYYPVRLYRLPGAPP